MTGRTPGLERRGDLASPGGLVAGGPQSDVVGHPGPGPVVYTIGVAGTELDGARMPLTQWGREYLVRDTFLAAPGKP